MNKEEFIKTHCLNCSTQRSEGINSAQFDGCAKKWELEDLCYITSTYKPIKVMYEGEQY